ncbi:MAG: hypothetical protein ACREYF_03450, partial [Gammaproteobacteria bacterium]
MWHWVYGRVDTDRWGSAIGAAEAVPGYRETKPVPKAEEEGEYLVISADGKGVPIRRAVEEPASVAHACSRGPKPDRKRMAIVGSVYTVDAVQRSAEEVVESLFRRPGEKPQEPRTPRAKPLHKQVRAGLSREREGVRVNATEEIIGWLADQARQRTSEHKTVVIMDGSALAVGGHRQTHPQGAAHRDPRSFACYAQRESLPDKTTSESHSGKRVIREIYRLPVEGLYTWGHLREIWHVKQTTIDMKTAEETLEERFFLTSLAPQSLHDAEVLQAVRMHWRIENNGFWTMDCVGGEDDAPWTHRALLFVSLLRLLTYNAVSRLLTRRLRQAKTSSVAFRSGCARRALVARKATALLIALRIRERRPLRRAFPMAL